jgi:hypothetical protein
MKIRIKEGTFYARMAARKMKSHALAIVWRNSVHLHNISREEFLKDKAFVLHELAHVRQFRRYGTFRFVVLYLWESLCKGYYNNRFEIEARKAETTGALKPGEIDFV